MKIKLALLGFSVLVFSTGCDRVFVSAASIWVGNTITLTAFQGLPIAVWARDTMDRIWTKRKRLVLNGTCARGVQTIIVSAPDGSQVNGLITCDRNAMFKWVYVEPGDGVYPLSMQAYNVLGQLIGDPIKISFVVRTTPPPPPIYITNGGQSFTSFGSSAVINGIFFQDAVGVNLIGMASVTSILSQMTFQVTAFLKSGQTQKIAVRSYDLAGNESSPISITVAFQNNLIVAATQTSGINSGGPMPSANYTLSNVHLTPFTKNGANGYVSTPTQPILYMGLTQMKKEENLSTP